MPIRLKKQKFARSHFREQEFGEFFNKASSGLKGIVPIIIAVFFTPALITTSIFSTEILVALANISLCLGYLTNFLYRLYKQEMSQSEFLISTVTIAVLIAGFYIFFPPAATLSAVSLIVSINQVAIVINGFFLIRHIFIPPIKHFMDRLAQYMGFEVTGSYYYKPPLELENGDLFVINHLLRKNYNHDSFSPEFKPEELEPFNNLLVKLTQYINKYDASLFGYIKNYKAISTLEQQILLLTTEGNTDASYTFIKKKIGNKETKLQLLEQAKEVVTTSLEQSYDNQKLALRFFKGVSLHNENNIQKTLQSGLEVLEEEISRQQDKLDSLQKCIPQKQEPISEEEEGVAESMRL